MLNEFADKQQTAYTIFKNQLDTRKLSHAYLIDDNDSNDAFLLVKNFIKSILCKHNLQCKDNSMCNICSLIDNENYPELKIIRPDGLFIKKEQVLELQEAFSKSSVFGDKKFYIIVDADKMRKETANSILKFLEEPTSNVIAFLITNNFNNMLSTIISRCQIIKLSNNNVNNSSVYDDVCLNFIKYVQEDRYSAFLNENTIFFDKVECKNKDNLILFVDTLVDMYYDILKVFIGNDTILYDKYLDKYTELSKMNSMSDILNKINFLIDVKDSIRYNVNVNLLLDSIIFNIGR